MKITSSIIASLGGISQPQKSTAMKDDDPVSDDNKYDSDASDSSCTTGGALYVPSSQHSTLADKDYTRPSSPVAQSNNNIGNDQQIEKIHSELASGSAARDLAGLDSVAVSTYLDHAVITDDEHANNEKLFTKENTIVGASLVTAGTPLESNPMDAKHVDGASICTAAEEDSPEFTSKEHGVVSAIETTAKVRNIQSPDLDMMINEC